MGCASGHGHRATVECACDGCATQVDHHTLGGVTVVCRVGAVAAGERVVASAAPQDVVAIARRDGVVAQTCGKEFVVGTDAREGVGQTVGVGIAQAAVEQIESGIDLDGDGLPSVCAGVGLVGRAARQVGAAHGHPIAFQDQVVFRITGNLQGARRAHIGHSLCGQCQGVAVVAAQIDQLDVGDRASGAGREVGGGFAHRQGVKARAAIHRSVCGVEHQHIVAAATDQDVASAATYQCVGGVA